MPARINAPSKICESCFELYNRKRLPSGILQDLKEYLATRYCSHSCYAKANIGEAHHGWKGGIHQRPDGYLRYSDNRFVHRVVMEEYLGRKLETWEHIHHVNGDKADNRIENLELHTNSSHRKEHAKTQMKDSLGRFC